MNNLDLIFKNMADGVRDKNPRYVVINSEHVMDMLKDIEYHLEYGEVYTVTSGEDKTLLLAGNQMTAAEAQVLTQLASELPKLYADCQRSALFALMSDACEPVEGKKPTTSPGERYVP
jgi:hypothetical protein